MRGFQPRSAAGAQEQRFADGGFVRGLADAVRPFSESVGGYWSNSNKEFEATNPGVGGRIVRAVHPVTGPGSAMGAMYDAAGNGSARDAAIAAVQAYPMFAAMKVIPAAKSMLPAAPQVAASVGKTASKVTRSTGAGVVADEAQARGFANGGRVRPRGFVVGKGTATSDSIPARLSNGEYVLPADTVRAVGVEALDALRESTHKPVKGEQSKAARGFFAGGTPGGVGARFQDQQREQEQRKQEALGAGRAADSAAQAAAAPATEAQLKALYQDWQDKKAPWYMPTPRSNMEERIAEAAYTKALANYYTNKLQHQPGAKPPASPAPTPTQDAATATTPATNLTDMRPASVPAPQALSYVGAMAKPEAPAFDFDTFQPQSGEGAFRNEQTGEVTRLQDGPTPRGFRAWKEPNVVPRADAPQAPRQDVRAPVLNPNGGVFSSMVDFTNQAGQAMQAIAANKGMRNDRKDALDQQRVGLDAASTFAKIEQGDRALGIDGRRADTAQDLAALQADELGLKREAQGFQTRAAKRLEKLQDGYLAAKTPEERATFARQIQELSGKGEGNLRDNFMAVGGGQEWDDQAGVMRNVPQRLVDLRTSRVVNTDGGQNKPLPAPKDVASRVIGQTYVGPNGKVAMWNGKDWTPV